MRGIGIIFLAGLIGFVAIAFGASAVLTGEMAVAKKKCMTGDMARLAGILCMFMGLALIGITLYLMPS